MSYAHSTNSLPNDRQQFERAVKRFEHAWHSGERPALADFLPAQGPLRGALLQELVAIDMEFRQQRGERCTISDYLQQFPELIAQPSRIDPRSQATLTQSPDSTASYANGIAPAPPAIPETFGRYKILRELGQGAMGAVYLAHDTQLDRQVALKIPKFAGSDSAEMVKRFYREARASANLRHAHVCPVFDVGEIEGQHYITMAYIEGRSLKEFIQRAKRPGERQAATVIRKLALGMGEAHARGVIHRDLKPANVMIDHRGEPVIMDFGLARRSAMMQSASTQEGTLLGTPAYMSPEQVEADPRQIGPASDIYSLGVILYELLTGQLPFQGDLMTVLNKIGREDPLPPSAHRGDLDRRLEAICLKMMARRKQDRFSSMQDVARALGDYLKSSGEFRTEETLLSGPSTASDTLRTSQPVSQAGSSAPSRESRESQRNSGELDPYLAWLSIAADRRPPTHYDLLGLAEFESDAQRIHQAAMERTALVRRYQLGKHAEAALRLLGELSLAFDCLSNAQRKEAYDAALRKQREPQVVADTTPALSVGSAAVSTATTPIMAPKLITTPRPRPPRRKLPPRVAIAASGAGVALLLAAVTLMLRVGRVDVQVVIDDPNLVVRIEGQTVTFEGAGQPIRLKPGEHNFTVERDGLVVQTDRFTVTKDGKNVLQVNSGDEGISSAKDGNKPSSAPQVSGLDYERRAAAWALSLREHTIGLTIEADGKRVGVASVSELPEKFNVVALNTWGNRLTDAGLANLEGLHRIEYFTNFTYAGGLITDVGMRTLCQLKSLKVLEISNNKITDDGLAELKGLSELRTLLLYASRDITDNGVQHIRPLTNLTELGITQSKITGSSLTLISELKELVFLNLGQSPGITDDGLRHLVDLPKLRTVRLDDSSINDAGLEWLSRIRTLDHLNISNTPVTDDGLTRLAEHKSLGALLLSGTKVTDAGLAELATLPKLHTLSLTRTAISDAGLPGLYSCQSLQSLDLSGTKVSPAGIEALKQALPKCKVIFAPAAATVATTAGPSTSPTPTAVSDESRKAPPVAVAPFDAPQARAHQEAWAAHLGTKVETTNSAGMRMVLIPPGEFLMGSTDEQIAAAEAIAHQYKADANAIALIHSERPQHKVVISEPFVMSATEVTVEQFKQFVEATKYVTEAEKAAGTNSQSQTYLNPGYALADDLPATVITWNDAVAYCQWLTAQEKQSYRLPTEAEWEYACRAGATGHYSFGDDHRELPKFGWYARNASGTPHAVATLLSNAFGLFDMHGNAYEWCQDYFEIGWYEKSEVTDPRGPVTGLRRAVRGGHWTAGFPTRARSAFRDHFAASRLLNFLGFRYVTQRPLAPDMGLSTSPASVSVNDGSLPSSISTADAARSLAQWVLARGGGVVVRVKNEAGPSLQCVGTIPIQSGSTASRYGLGEQVRTPASRLPEAEFELCGVGFRDFKFTAADLVRFQTVPLEIIVLRNANLDEDCLKAISQMNALYHLELMENASVTDATCAYLANLKRLDYAGLAGTGVTGAVIATLTQLPSLREVYLHGLPISDVQLSALNVLPKLETIHCNGATGEFATSFRHSQLKRFSGGDNLTRQGLQAIAGISTLEFMWLSDRCPGAWLEELKNHPSLKTLETYSDDKGIEHIKNIPHLKQVRFWRGKTTPAEIAELQRARPELKIITEPPRGVYVPSKTRAMWIDADWYRSGDPPTPYKVQFYAWQPGESLDMPAPQWQRVLEQPPLDETTVNRVDFRWSFAQPSNKVPADYFAAVVTQERYLPAGEYLVQTFSDDGIRVLIDDQVVLDDWVSHAARRSDAKIRLSDGTHKIRIEYFQAFGNAALQFSLVPTIDPASLPGIVIDDSQAKLTGLWSHGQGLAPFVGASYQFAVTRTEASARFELQIPSAGKYEVRMSWMGHVNRATNATCTIERADQPAIDLRLNQRVNPTDPQAFHSLGQFDFPAGPAAVVLSNRGADGMIHADAVQLLEVKPRPAGSR